MKILVAIDGSACALAALDALIKRLPWFSERPSLDLVYVHPALPYPAAAAWVGKDVVQRYYDDEAQAAVKPAQDKLDGTGVAHGIVKLIGDPAMEIARHAHSGGYDLIVMGTRGHTALANMVLGSVATKVLAGTKVPVLFLHQ